MTLLALFLFSQFQSEGPLEIKDLAVTENPVHFEKVEVSFGLTGTWNSPFDARQVSASATVVGPNNMFTTVYAYYDQPYKAVMTEEGEILETDGPPVWRLRYAPWRAGAYTVSLSVSDMHRRVNHSPLTVRAAARSEAERDTGGFVEILRNTQYLRISNRPFYPIGVNLKDAEATEEALRRVAASGANAVRLLISPEGLALNGRGNLGEFDLKNAWLLERLVETAEALGVFVLLSLNDGSELEAGWAKNPFNSANGGPVSDPEEFWTNHAARIHYKRQLRYLVSRLSANRALMGIEFFRGVEVPDYWMLEMGNEAYELHPYAIVITTEGAADSLVRTVRNTAVSAVMPQDTRLAVGLVERARKQTVKPVLALSLDARDPWRMMISGAAGVVSGGLKDLEALRALRSFSSEIDWQARLFELRAARGGEDVEGWALVDDRGGPVLLEAVGDEVAAGNAVISMRRGANYRYRWFAAETGMVVSEGQVRDVRGDLTLPYPAFRGKIAAVLTR